MSRHTWGVLVAALALAACSGGQPAGNGNTPSSNSAGNAAGSGPRPAVDLTPQDPEVRPEWLRVSCVLDSRLPKFTVGPETFDHAGFIKKLKEYGARQDPSAGLPGEFDPGISDNPVVLQAQWTDTSRALFEVMECCGNAGTWRLVLDLGSRRFRCDLPVETDLPPPPPSEFPKDKDGLPNAMDAAMGQTGRRSIRILPVFGQEKGVYGFSLKENRAETPIKETAFELGKLVQEDKTMALELWVKVRKALIDALEGLDIDGGGHEVSVIVCHKGSTMDKLAWASIAAVAVCIDAVDHTNARRLAQRKPVVSLTFRSIG